jgi:phosphoribosylformylglycinamidine synthase
MAASAIDEAIRNNISVGGRRMALLDNFSWGNPEKPDRLGGLVRAVEACRDFALAYGTPFISGKDSLYNESPLGPVTPSLLVTGIGLVPDVRKVVSMDLKEVGNPVYIVGKTLPELGCSEYYRIMGLLGSSLPRVYPKSSARSMKLITKAIDLGFIRSCHDLSEGGLGVAAAEMSFSGGSGLELHLDMMPQLNVERDDLLLFSESNSRFLLEVSKDKQADFENMMRNCDFGLIGEVRSNSELIIWGLEEDVVVESDIVDLRTSWKNTFGD